MIQTIFRPPTRPHATLFFLEISPGLAVFQHANALANEHQENYRILHDAINHTIKATPRAERIIAAYDHAKTGADSSLLTAHIGDMKHSPAFMAILFSAD
ncbi:TPA: hypothetical protein PL572_001447 [Cronobacter turicensis]|nr:hypothetical protein [Cronobacter turicensis]